MNITKNKIWLLNWALGLLLLVCGDLIAQPKRTLVFICSDEDKVILTKFVNEGTKVDSAEALSFIRQTIQKLQSNGYLSSGLDEISFAQDAITAQVWVGPQFRWATLNSGNLPENIMEYAGFKKRDFNQKIFTYSEIASLYEKVLKYSENHGYPFATIHLDSISVVEHQIYAKIKYEEGPPILFDSIVLEGNSKIKKQFLSSYLRVFPGQTFEERRFSDISFKLKRLSYLRLIEPPYLSFQNNEGTIFLNVEDKKVNQIDGIVGILPNAGNEGKVLMTGQFTLSLHNMFGSGKALHFEWQKLKPLSQLLDVSYHHPNVLASSVNIGTSFYLLKEDTTFINRDAGIGLSINKGLYSDIKVYTKVRSSSLLSTSRYKNSSQLPDFADFVLNSYGIGYTWSNVDDPLFPLKGMFFEIDATVGNKKIKPNSGIPKELYEDLKDGSMQFSATSEISKFSRVRKKIVILNRVRGGIVENDRLFLNDLFRIGGLNTLRGFNENFYFASGYVTTTLEVRMMLDSQSFFILFADHGYINYNLPMSKFEDHPTGLGLGFNLALEGGIFNFIYAVGAGSREPMTLQSSKIHFGYISRF